jgi:hypothetical protein
MDSLEHQLGCLADKLDTLSERFFTHSLRQQELLAELRQEVTSLGHCFSENHQDLQRIDHAVRGNGKEGVLDRVLKLEQAHLRLEEQKKRHLGALWAVLGAVVVYVLTTLLGKLL